MIGFIERRVGRVVDGTGLENLNPTDFQGFSLLKTTGLLTRSKGLWGRVGRGLESKLEELLEGTRRNKNGKSVDR